MPDSLLLCARKMSVRPLTSKAGAKSDKIRSLSLPKEFLPAAGTSVVLRVAFVVLPAMKELHLEAITFAEGRATIAFTAEGKNSETFWISLFKELAHILLRHVGPRMAYSKDAETQAMRLGLEKLLPSDQCKSFLVHKRFDEEAILAFANEERLHPSIVANRLRSSGMLSKKELGHLTVDYELSRSDMKNP